MPSKRTHDVTATVGEYTAGNGEKKKRYVNVGSAFTDEQGRLSIKMESVPVSPEWSGWLSLYPVKDKDDRESDRRQGRDRTPQDGYRQGSSPAEKYGKQPYSPPARDNSGGDGPDDGDEIPFRERTNPF